MEGLATTLIALGCLFFAGLVTDLVGRHSPLPRVTLLIVVGVAIGPVGLDLLPDLGARGYALVANMALVMIGFLLGGSLTRRNVRRHGRSVLAVSLSIVTLTLALVSASLLALGVGLPLAVLMAGIATATDPAALVDVVRQTRSDGRFTRTLLGVVAIDDAWGLLAFSLALVAAVALRGEAAPTGLLLAALWEIGGALLLGAALGVPMAYLSGRVAPGEPTLAEALGFVLLCGGLAIWLQLSHLLASMALGATVANLARHHSRPFRAIEGIEWPFMILFFVLSGASLRLDSLDRVGIVAALYVVARVVARLGGAWLGARLVGVDGTRGARMGLALLPQAGVALGTALVAAQRFPELADTLIPVTVSAVVLFEVVGPVLTRRQLAAVGECAGSAKQRPDRIRAARGA